MLNYIDFDNCYIVNVGNEIRPMILYFMGKDEKTKLKYCVFKDIFSNNYKFIFSNKYFRKITEYMFNEELDEYSSHTLDASKQLSIIARAIKSYTTLKIAW